MLGAGHEIQGSAQPGGRTLCQPTAASLVLSATYLKYYKKQRREQVQRELQCQKVTLKGSAIEILPTPDRGGTVASHMARNGGASRRPRVSDLQP